MATAQRAFRRAADDRPYRRHCGDEAGALHEYPRRVFHATCAAWDSVSLSLGRPCDDARSSCAISSSDHLIGMMRDRRLAAIVRSTLPRD
jgi:hypothetical protein